MPMGLMILGQPDKMFYGEHVVICHNHARGLRLQPVMSEDWQRHLICPFCPGGALEGKFHEHRSKIAIERALDELDEQRRKFTACRRCLATIAPYLGEIEPARMVGGVYLCSGKFVHAPGETDDICDDCEYGEIDA